MNLSDHKTQSVFRRIQLVQVSYPMEEVRFNDWICSLLRQMWMSPGSSCFKTDSAYIFPFSSVLGERLDWQLKWLPASSQPVLDHTFCPANDFQLCFLWISCPGCNSSWTICWQVASCCCNSVCFEFRGDFVFQSWIEREIRSHYFWVIALPFWQLRLHWKSQFCVCFSHWSWLFLLASCLALWVF